MMTVAKPNILATVYCVLHSSLLHSVLDYGDVCTQTGVSQDSVET